MKKWIAPQRPIEYAKQSLIKAILDGTFPPDSTFPGERDLATRLGITRPTLREALRCLESDGWLTIQQGKSTKVNNFRIDGGLNVLGALVQYNQDIPPDFIPNLLEVRLALAPAYTSAAVVSAAAKVVDYLTLYSGLDDTPEAFSQFDWGLHHLLTVASNNYVYTLILNGFSGFYERMAQRYFIPSEARDLSRNFYATLMEAAINGDALEAERLTRVVMHKSIILWKKQTRI